MDRRILFILIMSLAVPYGCSMALLGTSLAKPGGLKEQEALSAAWASDSREKRSFRRIRMDMEDRSGKKSGQNAGRCFSSEYLWLWKCILHQYYVQCPYGVS